MGVATERVKTIVFFVSSVMTAGVVGVAGMIGFVGLLIPHLARLVIGPNHRNLIPACAILGGIFMLLCDALSRAAFAPVEIPIGVVTACVGAPLFILLLKLRPKER